MREEGRRTHEGGMEGRAPLPEFIYKLFYEKPIYKKIKIKKLHFPTPAAESNSRTARCSYFWAFFS
jgi:hypothetical protein